MIRNLAKAKTKPSHSGKEPEFFVLNKVYGIGGVENY